MMKRTDRRDASGQRGFTLFELVISITVMGITMGGLVFQINNAMVNAHRPIQEIQSLFLAKESIEEALHQYRTGKGPAVTPSAEQPMTEFPQFNRVVNVSAYPAPDCTASDAADCVDVTVILSDSNANRTIRRLDVRLPLPE